MRAFEAITTRPVAISKNVGNLNVFILILDPVIRTPRLPQEYSLVHIVKRRTGEKVLAKGRKDLNEAIADAAVRETFEETGYRNAIVGLPTPSLAPGARDVPINKEAIGVTLNVDSYCRKEGGIKVQKLVFWFVSEVLLDDQGTPVQRVEGTQLAYEDYEVWEMSLDDSLSPDGISNPTHRQMVEVARSLLLKRYEIATAQP